MSDKKTQKKRPEARKKNKKNISINTKIILFLGVTVVIISVFWGAMRSKSGGDSARIYQWPKEGISCAEPNIDVQLLTVNPYSRPGKEVQKINGIVVHYTANPGASAQDNRDYFESLKDTKKTKASSNFIIGLSGEIIQCVPTWEEAYASNDRNMDTISIECCHWDETGELAEDTYWALVQLCAFLCDKYHLNQEDIIRHYDVTGKNCPKYFVEHQEAWDVFLSHVGRTLK